MVDGIDLVLVGVVAFMAGAVFVALAVILMLSGWL
jgi:hypothetical protein